MEIKRDYSNNRVFLVFDHITKDILNGIEWGNKEASFLFEHEKDKQILDRRNKAGVTYRKSGRTLKRSAATQTAAEESGDYRKSFEFQDQGGRGFIWGTTSPYGGFLEEGTSHMAARPGVKNVTEKLLGTLQGVYEKQIAKASKILQ